MFTFKLSRDQYGLLLAALDEAAASTVLDQSKRIIDLINAIEAQVKTTDEPVQLELPLGYGVTATVTPETYEPMVAGLEGLAAGLPVQLTRPASLTELQLGAPVLKPKRAKDAPRRKRKAKTASDFIQEGHREAEAVAAAIAKDFPATKAGPSDDVVKSAAIKLGQEWLASGLATDVKVQGVTLPLGTIRLSRPGG